MNRFKCIVFVSLITATFFTAGGDVLAQKGKGGKGGNGGDSGPSYTIVPLDSGDYILDEGRGKVGAFDISDVDIVVGAGNDPIADRTKALCWQLNGTESVVFQLPDLESFDPYYAVGRAVNNLGQIVGWTGGLTAGGSSFLGALYWSSPFEVPCVLPALTDQGYAYAYDINDSGIICGYSRDPEFDANGGYVRSRNMPVVWSVTYASGQPQIAGPVPLPVSEDGRANAVTTCDANGVAYVVGGMHPSGVSAYPRSNAAVTWRVALGPGGTLTADPQPVVLEAGEAEALAVNNTGAVTGQALVGNDPPLPKARVWADGTGFTLADDPSRKVRGVRYHALDIHAGFGINNSGVVVGSLDYARYTPSWEAAVWLTPTSEPIVLGRFLPDSSLLYTGLTEARAINESGWIVGKGNVSGADSFAFLAVPE